MIEISKKRIFDYNGQERRMNGVTRAVNFFLSTFADKMISAVLDV